uniref:class I SAM-dependent methyltransferase n=1 Tax=Sphingomonas sp. TaxID=28214 RepID=UPI0025E74053
GAMAGSTASADAASAAPAAVSQSVEARVAAAIADPKRIDTDRERDLRDHPQEVLTLAGFKPGDAIADIFGGGGYYSELIADIVGPSGSVRLINNQPYDGFSKKGREPRLAGNRLPNVRYEVLPPSAMNLGKGTLDGALIVMSYHDLYVVEPNEGWPAIDAGQFIDQIVAGLKPGGVLLIVDHEARPGSGKADTQALHRIEDSFAAADFKAHGLKLVGSLDLLRNPDDDHSKNVFDPAIRGKTDRFVYRFRKPR